MCGTLKAEGFISPSIHIVMYPLHHTHEWMNSRLLPFSMDEHLTSPFFSDLFDKGRQRDTQDANAWTTHQQHIFFSLPDAFPLDWSRKQ
jgi:hypothetical protein